MIYRHNIFCISRDPAHLSFDEMSSVGALIKVLYMSSNA